MWAWRENFPPHFLSLVFSLELNSGKCHFPPYFPLPIFHLPCFHHNQTYPKALFVVVGNAQYDTLFKVILVQFCTCKEQL